MTENEIAKLILDKAFIVHTKLGPGLLESVYEIVLAYEPRKAGLAVERQKPMPIIYDSVRFDEAFRTDLLVNAKDHGRTKISGIAYGTACKASLNPAEDERFEAWTSHQFWRSPSEERNQAAH